MGASEFYLQPPFRFMYFRLTAIGFLIELFGLGLIVVARWNRLDLFIALSLFLSATSMGFFWLVALRAHRQVRSLFETGQIDKLELGSNLDSVLSIAAIITNQGLLFASLSMMGLLAVLGDVLLSH